MPNRHSSNGTSGAWAFIVLLECHDQDNVTYRFHSATSQPPSQSNMNAEHYHGVGELIADATSAEAAGMIAVQCWIIQSQFCCPHNIYFGNKTIGDFAAGKSQWNAKWEHSQLCDNLATLRHCLQADRRELHYSHVKAHEGHPINEAVDNMAKSTVRGILPVPKLPADLSKVLLNRSFKYAWIHLVNPANVPWPAAFPGVFKDEGPFFQRPEDTTWHHDPSSQVTEDVCIKLSFASANVLTLDSGNTRKQIQGLMQQGRIATLQAQFSKAAHHVVGVQECRTQGQYTCHSVSHLVYQSGASEDGARGCELWLNKSQPQATSRPQQFCFADNHVHIASYDDRHLMAIIQAPHLSLRVLVVHAPHQGICEEQRNAWWKNMTTLITKVANHLPLVILGDMNARVGTVTSDCIGEHGAEEENSNGHYLHMMGPFDFHDHMLHGLPVMGLSTAWTINYFHKHGMNIRSIRMSNMMLIYALYAKTTKL